MLRFLRCLILASVLLALTPRIGAAQQRTDDFEPAACMFDVPATLTEGENLECGYLTVPASHRDPTGPTIQLAVAIIQSTDPNPAPDPLILLQGGPGGSTIDTYSQYLGIGRLSGLRADRDLILFDQRGTLHSSPALICPEFVALTEETIERRVPREEGYQLSLRATQECHDRLVGEGIDLSAFNSLENAHDVDSLRIALGYDTVNLYGVSYGTLLALHTMREHPEGLRSVILDAVVPTQTNFIPVVAQSQERAFRELFGACAADAACNAAYPNLDQVFADLIAELNTTPANVPITDPETQKRYSAVIDGDTLLQLTFQMLYSTEILPAIPHVIYQMRDGDFSFFSAIAGQILFDRTVAYGMYDSVICAEDADFQASDVDVTGVRPELARYAEEDAENLIQTCDIWDVPEVDAPLDRPVSSDIPTLVLNGRFDPITPPANGEEAARTLSRSYVYTFGYTGHGAMTTGPCPEQVIRDFLNDPARAPDNECIAERPAPVFITPATVRFVPHLARALNDLNQGSVARLLLPIVALGGLLSLFLIWPLLWVIRVARNRPAKRTPLTLAARLAAVLAAALGVVFIVGLIAVVFMVATQGQEVTLLFGVPAGSGWLLAIPWLIGACTLAMIGGLVLIWRQGAWSMFERAYYALLVLAAIGLSAGLIPFALA